MIHALYINITHPG